MQEQEEEEEEEEIERERKKGSFLQRYFKFSEFSCSLMLWKDDNVQIFPSPISIVIRGLYSYIKVISFNRQRYTAESPAW